MIKVLSIGNSFSQDAQRYLCKVAAGEGVNMKCVNLYIGGCSLYMHYVNMLDDRKNYSLEFNGETTGFYVSIREALISDEWDFVTLQQVSRLSFDYESYIPYLEKLAEYVKLYAPKAKLLMHETWAYENGTRRVSELGFRDSHEMLAGVVDTYKKAAEAISADGIIPCGEAVMAAVKAGLEMHRDGSHIDLGIGRYLLALVWYKTVVGRTAENSFTEFDVEVSPEDAERMRHIAAKIF